MTDEEKAEKYANSFWGVNPSTQRVIKRAYFAGLKAGRPKWHKVADGDYPPLEKDGFTVNVFTDRGEIAYYNHDFDYWIAEPAIVEIDSPVAWCEIPKYKE